MYDQYYVTITYKDGTSEELHDNVVGVAETKTGSCLLISFYAGYRDTHERRIPMERIHEYSVKTYRSSY